eukprot:scaffold73341_cov14-Tisochrysis_lutea.AAC.1
MQALTPPCRVAGPDGAGGSPHRALKIDTTPLLFQTGISDPFLHLPACSQYLRLPQTIPGTTGAAGRGTIPHGDKEKAGQLH